MDEVKISIIMGVYNAGNDNMLQNAIDSILNQSYRNFEFIICDDGSTDDTYRILKKLAVIDTRIVLLQNKNNLGLAASLNKCLEASRGRYIARMDADDVSASNRLEEELNFLDKHNEYAFVGSGIYLFDDTGTYGKRIYEEKPERRSFLFNSPFIHPTIMIRKEALASVNGYRIARETKRMEDYDLFMRLYYYNHKGYNLPECLYYYREDKQAFAKRKYRYRIDEAIVRYQGFRLLKLMPIGYIYVVKPLIVGLLPNRLIRKLKKDIIY